MFATPFSFIRETSLARETSFGNLELAACSPKHPDQNQFELQAIEATSIPYASRLDRACTVLGLIEEAPVEFQSADGVSCAGALLGLALLDETHLLEEARAVYGRLKSGWYGLRSLVWTLVVMALVRISVLMRSTPAWL